MKDHIKFVQAELTQKKLKPGPVDGILGAKTIAALNKVKRLPASWSTERKVVGFIQLTAAANHINPGKIDGFWGPLTKQAFEELQHLWQFGTKPKIWRPEDRVAVNPNNWPSQRSDQELIDFYGAVGKDQRTIEVPYTHVIAWNTAQKTNKITCNKKVADSLLRVLHNVKQHYGLAEIKRLRLDMYGGCLNVRKMRGGSRYSMHSWGIALDYDPANNRLNWGRDKASFARPEYNAWWEIWEAEGWTSLGRARNYDWMHVQAAGI